MLQFTTTWLGSITDVFESLEYVSTVSCMESEKIQVEYVLLKF